MNQSVAIFGATGAQGSPVVQQALARGLTVRAIARNADRIAETHPDAEAFGADLSDQDSVIRAFTGVDSAFIHLPIPSGPDEPAAWLGNVIAAAHAASLKLLVFSTGSIAGPRYPSSIATDGSTAVTEALLSSGIPTIILQPTIYLENLLPPVFLPRLRGEGIMDYPPVTPEQKIMWTSHHDQARVAAAALTRPDLAGQKFELGSPDALTGVELAQLLADALDRDVRFDPLLPDAFGDRATQVFGNPGTGEVLADLYRGLNKLPADGMDYDLTSLAETFGVKLTSVADHIAGWQMT